MAQQEEKLPEWMLRLESKRNRRNRLAHEIGAGAPCFVCGDSCPGLDLHFWRKLCRNCKCKKEDHDVKDDDGYEQFEILLGSGPKKRMGGFLKLKVPDEIQTPVVLYEGGAKGVSFDWLPPNVSDEVAVEYMQQLPASKLPISGSDGALYRKQQLEKQVPLHDLDAKHCHNLTPEEIDQLMKYLDNLKSNVVGQGSVGKVPLPYSETRPSVLGPTSMVAGSQALGRPLPTSQSADTLRPLPPMPPSYNSAPRPFHPRVAPGAVGVPGDGELPPPLPLSLPPRPGLKTPSDFLIDWHLQEDKRSVGQVADDLGNLTLHPQGGAGSHFVKENFPKELSVSTESGSLVPQYSANLPPLEHHAAAFGRKSPETATLVGGRPVGTASHLVDTKGEAITGTVRSSGVATVSAFADPSDTVQPLPLDGRHVSSGLPGSVAYSSDGNRLGVPGISKPWSSADPGCPSADDLLDPSKPLPIDGKFLASVPPTGFAKSEEGSKRGAPGVAAPLSGKVDGSVSSVRPLPSDGLHTSSALPAGIAYSSDQSRLGTPGMSKPLTGYNVGHAGGDGHVHPLRPSPSDTTSATSVPPAHVAPSSEENTLGVSRPLDGGNVSHARTDSSVDPTGLESLGSIPANTMKHSSLNSGSTVHSMPVGRRGVPGVSQPLQGGTGGLSASSAECFPQLPNSGPLPRGGALESNTVLNNPPTSLNIEGVVTSNVFPHNVIHSSAVGTDALPKSAQAMQQNTVMVDPSSAGVCAGTSATLPAETPGGSVPSCLPCHECSLDLHAGDVAVFAERANSAAWHPGCFVCSTCKELLVDLMYFYHKGKVYCGRHFADLLGIPRCFACDELIFVKEYTVAEGKGFHVKHFCCYECDEPLGGKRYVPVEEQPVCLECYERIYGKQCHTCQKIIGAGDQRINWKHLDWHVQGNCFRCFECAKSLLGGRFVVREDQPFCSKECVQTGLSKMAGAA